MKRLIDLLLVGIAAPVVVPLLLLLALLVRMRLGNPILFTQYRPGLNGRPFVLVKFRTMSSELDSSGGSRTDGERLSKFGYWLRATSLDELPELWNVLKGEMSLVGPRPLRMEYLALYSREQASRHSVLPGLTGWAQIKGRNSISWDEKFDLDIWYVNHRTLLLDLEILIRTMWRVLKREGISHSRDTTMPWFTGTDARDD